MKQFGLLFQHLVTLVVCVTSSGKFQNYFFIDSAPVKLRHQNVDFEEEITHPVLICDKKCFRYLNENEEEKKHHKNINHLLYDLKLNREEKRKLKLCGIHRNTVGKRT